MALTLDMVSLKCFCHREVFGGRQCYCIWF